MKSINLKKILLLSAIFMTCFLIKVDSHADEYNTLVSAGKKYYISNNYICQKSGKKNKKLLYVGNFPNTPSLLTVYGSEIYFGVNIDYEEAIAKMYCFNMKKKKLKTIKTLREFSDVKVGAKKGRYFTYYSFAGDGTGPENEIYHFDCKTKKSICLSKHAFNNGQAITTKNIYYCEGDYGKLKVVRCNLNGKKKKVLKTYKVGKGCLTFNIHHFNLKKKSLILTYYNKNDIMVDKKIKW